jgi:beta-N-acetylhexosaminidase
MSLKEKVGQLVMFLPNGLGLSSGERAVMRDRALGGVILFSKNYRDRSQLRALTAQIQKVARNATPYSIGGLISVDQEGGVVKRFSDMPPAYSAPEMGAMDVSVSYRQGVATGRALHSVGVNMNLAPVADLDLGPNHVMRSRSFGSSPHPVGQRVRRFAGGLQSKRVVATLKHFPGLGGATVNSDDGRSYVYRSKRQLRNEDGVPFQRAINAGARSVMLSHAIYVHERGKRPASINHHIMKKRLRRDLGFTGVAISDSLDSIEWWFGGDMAKTCKATIKAGTDIALLTSDVYVARSCARAIGRAVRDGSLSRSRLDKAVKRVLELKDWLGIFDPAAAIRP